MHYLYFFWFIPVIEFLIFPNNLGSINSIIIPTIYVFYSIIRKRYKVLINSLPFYLILSNLGPTYFSLLYAEYISLICLIVLASYLANLKNLKINSTQLPIIGMLIIFILSFAVSLEYESLYKGFINGIFLFTIYGLTRLVINNEICVIEFLKTFTIAVTYASIVIIFSYYNGINLNNFNKFSNMNVYNQELSQATFFYTNIIYLTPLATIFSFYILCTKNTHLTKLLFFGMLVIILFGISKIFNKTVLVVLFVIGILFLKKLVIRRKLKIKYIFFASTTLAFFLVLVNLYLLQEKESYRSLDLTSLYIRLLVLESSLTVLLKNIHVAAFGLGPEGLFRLMDNTISLQAKSHFFGTEGAIDSAYISYLFEYGIFFLLFFTTYVVNLMIKLLFVKNKNLNSKINLDNLSYVLALVCLSVLLCAFVQVLGLGKISVIIFQVFACSEIIINEKKKVTKIKL